MAKFLLGSGLPDLPAGLPDKDASLVTPLYLGVNALANQLSVQTGNVQYDAAEMAVVDQFSMLIDHREQKLAVKALEAISFGSLLTLVVDGGKLAARKADATDLTKPAHAICDTAGGIASGSFGMAIFMRGRSLGISGTTLGAAYYLSTSGNIQVAVPTADGVLNQVVGVGLGSAGFYLNIEPIGRRVSRIYKPNVTTLRTQYTDGTYVDHAV